MVKTAVVFSNGIGNFLMALPAISTLNDPVIVGFRGDARMKAIEDISPYPVVYEEQAGGLRSVDKVYSFWGDSRAAEFASKHGWRHARVHIQRFDHKQPYTPEYRQALEFVRYHGTDVPEVAIKAIVPEAVRRYKRYVAVGFGSAVRSKKWSPENVRKLCERLTADGHCVVFVGDKDDARFYRDALLGLPILNLAGRCSISRTAGIFQRAQYAILNDSGLLHLADSVGCRSVSLWGPTSWDKSQPAHGTTQPLFATADCAPCYEKVGGRQHTTCTKGRCMGSISIDRVMEAVSQMTSVSKRARPNKNPLVSVVICSHNDAAYLDALFRSIERSDYKRVETILVNDKPGPTDTTIGYRERATKYYEVQHGNANKARNHGLRHATGEYLVFPCADTEFKSHALTALVRALEGNPRAASAYGDVECRGMKSGVQRAGDLDYERLKKGNYITGLALFRRSTFPGWDERLTRLQDWEVWLNIASRGGQAVYLDDILFAHTWRADGITFGTTRREHDVNVAKISHKYKLGLRPKKALDVVAELEGQPTVKAPDVISSVISDDMTDDVSIVIPIISDKHIHRCLDALRQTAPKAEIVVVVDGAVDIDSHRISERGAVVIRKERNTGFADTCNVGVAASTGEIVILLNDDTEPLPGWYDALLDPSRQHGYDYAGPMEISMRHDKKLSRFFGVRRGEILFGDLREGPAPAMLLNGFCLAIRRDRFYDVGQLERCYKNSCEDIDLCMRLTMAGCKGYFSSASRVRHRQEASRRGHPSTNITASRDLFRQRWRSISLEENG